MNDEILKPPASSAAPSVDPPPLPTSPSQRHVVIHIFGWIAVIFGALMAASGAAQLVMGMIYAPPVVGLILGLLMTIGGL
jgi:hypothetical protein